MAIVFEAVPAAIDFDKVCGYGVDLSASGVSMALEMLGWEFGASPKPLLCVAPSGFAHACRLAKEMYGVVEPHALQALRPTVDAWFVAWNGRRVGSEGA
jgi:hypothetical protein